MPLRTYLKLTLVAIFWGGAWIAGRIAIQEIQPFEAAFLRFLVAIVVMSWLVYREEGGLPLLDRQEWLNVAWLGVTGVFAYNYFFLHSLEFVKVGQGALVVALNPVIVALTASLWFGEPMKPLKAVGIATALIGSLFVIGNGYPPDILTGHIGTGEMLVIGCVISWTLYTFAGRRATRTLSPLVANFYGCIIGCSMLGIAAVSERSVLRLPHFSLYAWLSVFYLGYFGTALSYIWFTDAVKQIGAAKSAAFINLVPVSALLLAVVLLGERLQPIVLLGGGVTLAGVIMTNFACIDVPVDSINRVAETHHFPDPLPDKGDHASV